MKEITCVYKHLVVTLHSALFFSICLEDPGDQPLSLFTVLSLPLLPKPPPGHPGIFYSESCEMGDRRDYGLLGTGSALLAPGSARPTQPCGHLLRKREPGSCQVTLVKPQGGNFSPHFSLLQKHGDNNMP